MLLHPPRARDGFETLARGRLGDMNRAGRAGVEGVHRAQRVDGLLDIAHRHADQSLLERTVLALLVLRSQVPRGRDDDLVTLDLAVLDRLAVVESAARGLPEAGARRRCWSQERGSTRSRRTSRPRSARRPTPSCTWRCRASRSGGWRYGRAWTGPRTGRPHGQAP